MVVSFASVDSRNVGSRQEVVLSGRLDVSSVSSVRSVLHSAIDTGTGDLFVDLSGVEMIDATGLGVLVGAHRRAVLCGRRVVLRNVSGRVSRILRATRLNRILSVEPITGQ